MVKTSCKDPGRGRMTTSSSSSYITTAVWGEKEETTQYSSLSRNPERLPSSNLPSHTVMGVYEATFSSCPSIAISNLAGGGLLLQHQGPQHAQLLVVYSRGCPTVYGHPEAGHVWMGTPGTPMSMGPQCPMTLLPSTSNLPWSRLGTISPSPVNKDIFTSYTVDDNSPPGSYYGLFATFLPAIITTFLDTTIAMTRDKGATGYGLDLGKLPVSFTNMLLVSLGEGEIKEPDVGGLDQPLYISLSTAAHDHCSCRAS